MAREPEALIALRRRVEAVRASPCGMAHESIPAGSDGNPVRSTRSPSGFARAGLCPEAVRAANLACSHTMARYELRDAIMQVPSEGDEAVVAALHELEQAISLLDHRRYDAESRRASVRLAETDDAPGEREIAALVAEHRASVTRVGELRDDVLRRIDDALGAAGADTSPQASRTGVQIPTAEAAQGRSLPSPSSKSAIFQGGGAPGEIRTPDPQIRSLVLYPAELRALGADS
jgi:hypothetical protein